MSASFTVSENIITLQVLSILNIVVMVSRLFADELCNPHAKNLVHCFKMIWVERKIYNELVIDLILGVMKTTHCTGSNFPLQLSSVCT